MRDLWKHIRTVYEVTPKFVRADLNSSCNWDITRGMVWPCGQTLSTSRVLSARCCAAAGSAEQLVL